MTAPNRPFGTVADVVRWLELAPASTLVAAPDLARILAPLADAPAAADQATIAPEATWREKLWSVPPETRIGVPEVAEAIGRPRSWVYRHTSEKAAGADRLPHRRLDG